MIFENIGKIAEIEIFKKKIKKNICHKQKNNSLVYFKSDRRLREREVGVVKPVVVLDCIHS